MTGEQKKIAEKIIDLIRNNKKAGIIINELINRTYETAYIQKHKIYEQIIPILRDGDEKGVKYIKRVSKFSEVYELTDPGINFTSYEDIEIVKLEEEERREESHLLTKEQRQQIKESRILSAKAEERAENAERRAKRAELRAWIAVGVAIIGALPLLRSLLKMLIKLFK